MPPTLIRYAFLLMLLSACSQKKPSHRSRPDAVRDLLIDRIVWRPQAVTNQPGLREDKHQFTLTNTSDEHRYRQIRLRFDYYDERYRRVATKRYLLDQEIAAGTAVSIAPFRLGQTHSTARSVEVRVEKAQAD